MDDSTLPQNPPPGDNIPTSHNTSRPTLSTQNPKQTRELKVEDALLYLDQVKVEFSDKPHVYNEFLEIMKNFKAQSINTPGVIERVKNLFRGYNKLILGFNTFLPEGEGYKIEITAEDEAAAAAHHANMQLQAQQQQQQQIVAQGHQGAVVSTTRSPSPALEPTHDTSVAGGGYKPQAMQQQHAISYVTQIRNRFANEPETYRAFLKILHTYQKEQKGIKDVLEQVSQLFADHPDLLMEFTYFLPDAVQEQAKERLHRAATESENRKKQRQLAAQAQQQFLTQNMPQVNPMKRSRADKERDKELAKQTEREAKKQNMSGSQARKIAKKNKDLASSTLQTYDSIGNHSICSERKYFDHVKDLFTSTSRDAWQEFVKCLELYSHDAISKKDMMSLVQELFGPSNVDLFDEFKALLNHRAAYDASGQDMWFAIPLSEIDFSQCRKCTPSYRALPKDYPRPQCSERSTHDMSVLSDDWVSIPIGSEEAYSFKHMRKNQHEEALFRCEDERFEIDMVIDSNMCTLKLLEPMAEEINNMRALEEEGRTPKFNFQLEKRNLGVVHLHSISRIYGENGTEILELLFKNPAGAIPVILKRLKQKDAEWRKARQELNKAWKETIDKNYERSFDHRSHSFRNTDKRFYSAKNLVADIKGGVAEAGVTAEDLLKSPGISFTFPPELKDLLGDMHPGLVLAYDSADQGALQDVYRVICHAMEATGCSPNDKERIAALWRDLLRVFFNMPVYFLYGSSVGNIDFDINATLGLDPATVGDSEKIPVDIAEAWQVDSTVLTLFGSGKVMAFRPADNTYQIKLPFGVGFLKPAVIIGAEELPVNALEAIGVTFDANLNEFVNNVNITEKRSKCLPSDFVTDPSKIFYGTQMTYIFFRLHHTLYWRFVLARRLANESLDKVPTDVHPMKQFDEEDDESDAFKTIDTSKPVYKSFLSQLYALMDGSIDNARYEDVCRQLLSNKAYFVYTLDKVIQQLIKCLQSMANDENVTKLVGIFMHHRSHPNGVDPAAYQHHVSSTLSHTLEDVYRIQLITRSLNDTTEPIVVACQLLGTLPSGNASATQNIKAPQAILTDAEEEEMDVVRDANGDHSSMDVVDN